MGCCVSPRTTWLGSLGIWCKRIPQDVRPLPGVGPKHFTARDVISRRDVLDAYHTATAHSVTEFLDAVEERMPFAIKVIQVDGG